MKLKIDAQKSSKAVSDVIQKTAEVGKKVAVSVQNSAKDLSEKAKDENYIRRMKKYNPLFPDKFKSEDFNIPNMIIIVDDAVRRGIDVCEGAIGWLSNENGIEVLHLYDEAIGMSGIQFVPAAVCDAVYYVDNFDRNRFINLDCIFDKAQEERLAELKHIAYSLGAKRCSIEISESSSKSEVKKKKFDLSEAVRVKDVQISSDKNVEKELSYQGKTQRSGKVTAEFEGSSSAQMPTLKWFQHDETIKKLIAMRCDGSNPIKKETLMLEGSASATMSQKAACAIDNAINKMGVKGKSDIETKATRENRSKLVFEVEF